jgi:enamine deaminase RidA (YjgF/YER057c/UK114 family)
MTYRSGSTLLVSGHGSFEDGVPSHVGRLGDDLTTAQGAEAARAVMLGVLSTVKSQVSQLSRASCQKLIVFVNSTPDFREQHLVANGATDLLARLYGPGRRRPARSAIGVAALPLGFAVEIEAVFEIEPA